MFISASVGVLLVVTGMHALPTLERFDVESFPNDNGNGATGYHAGQREKRSLGRVVTLGSAALKGLWARTFLLKGAEPVRKSGMLTSYEKHAGSEQMILDFLSVKPTNVYNTGGGRTGKIGDRTIRYHLSDVSLIESKNWIAISKVDDRLGKVINVDFIYYMD